MIGLEHEGRNKGSKIWVLGDRRCALSMLNSTISKSPLPQLHPQYGYTSYIPEGHWTLSHFLFQVSRFSWPKRTYRSQPILAEQDSTTLYNTAWRWGVLPGRCLLSWQVCSHSATSFPEIRFTIIIHLMFVRLRINYQKALSRAQ